MDTTLEQKLNPDQDLDSQTELIQHLDTHLKLTQDDDANQEDDDEYEYEEEEFSFFCGDTNTSPVAAEDAFVDGHIKSVFPLFNRDLVFSEEDIPSMPESLPMNPPVKKVFVETNEENSHHAATSSATEDDEISGPYCEWSSRKAVEVSPEIAKKSNSTGFSRIWRFKEFVVRSHSDGRDAFVFLNNHGHATSQTAEKHAPKAAAEEKGHQSTVKIVRKVKKGKTTPLSAHEVYLRSKGKQNDQRRRSYLPYRPELMGFFTTVSSGGLTKNVHPY